MNAPTTPLPDKKLARQIIERVGSSGQPPEEGLNYFSVGLDPYLSIIDTEYLNDYIRDGGSAFKMVIGIYGGGKTHFLYSIRQLAWNRNYAVAYVSLKSSGECPFYALELVYKAIAHSVLPPLPIDERMNISHPGIGALLESWYGQQFAMYKQEGMSIEKTRERLDEKIRQIEIGPSISFGKAIRSALEAVHNGHKESFSNICQWLYGERYDRKIHTSYGIQQKIDRTTAMDMIRSLGQAVRALGYTGLVILLDEAEQVPSLSTKNREQHLSNLRELIDECSQSRFAGIMVFYAVPDENFLNGRTQVYEALNQRLSTVLRLSNPTGVKIMLEDMIKDHGEFLRQVGERLAWIYSLAFEHEFHPNDRDRLITLIAEWAERARYGDEGYKRLFVQKLIQGLGILHREGRIPDIDELS